MNFIEMTLRTFKGKVRQDEGVVNFWSGHPEGAPTFRHGAPEGVIGGALKSRGGMILFECSATDGWSCSYYRYVIHATSYVILMTSFLSFIPLFSRFQVLLWSFKMPINCYRFAI